MMPSASRSDVKVSEGARSNTIPYVAGHDDEARNTDISGNASDEVKQSVKDFLPILVGSNKFANSVGLRIAVTEVDIHASQDDSRRKEACVVCEIDVTQDMLNNGSRMHGGCTAYLIDICSSLPIYGLAKSMGKTTHSGVSLIINTVYHSPASLGDRLRIVSTSLTVGARSMSARCEIWSMDHRRLVASGTHVKMEPSARL